MDQQVVLFMWYLLAVARRKWIPPWVDLKITTINLKIVFPSLFLVAKTTHYFWIAVCKQSCRVVETVVVVVCVCVHAEGPSTSVVEIYAPQHQWAAFPPSSRLPGFKESLQNCQKYSEKLFISVSSLEEFFVLYAAWSISRQGEIWEAASQLFLSQSHWTSTLVYQPGYVSIS